MDVIYIQLQSMWKDFVKNTYACCSPAFWSVYKAVHGQTATCIDAVLHAVKNLVEVPGRWPQSNRALLRLITKHSGDFWSNVVYTKKIDLDIPKLDNFVHKVYISLARKIYKNVYLYEKYVTPLQYQKNMREADILCKESILEVIRDSVPVEKILRAYIDEIVDEEGQETSF